METTQVLDNKEPQYNNQIYEKTGITKESKHQLGSIQEIIRGRYYFFFLGLLFILIFAIGLYLVFIEKKELFFERNTINSIFFLVISIGGIFYGLRFMYFSTRKLILRREGFELVSIFGKKSYEYKEATFTLYDRLEHKNGSGGSSFSGNRHGFQRVWILYISLINQQKSFQLKSTEYSRLKCKAMNLTNSLTWVN